MASSAKPFSLFLLITLLSSFQTHARENQFFNKVSTTTNVDNNLVPDTNTQPLNDQPNFLSESENSYGLYRHNPDQLPPSAAVDAAIAAESKQPADLPNTYNPVAYVTQPEDTNIYAEEKSYYYNNNGGRGGAARNYYYNNNHQEKEEEELPSPYRSYNPTTRNNNNNYYGGGSSFNSQPQGLSDTSFRRGGGGFQPQGMSDTRSLENGKYFYDINIEKYNSNHPYERLRRAAAVGDGGGGDRWWATAAGLGWGGWGEIGGICRNWSKCGIFD